jgi:hypothetical protein
MGGYYVGRGGEGGEGEDVEIYYAYPLVRVYERALKHLRRWNIYHSVIIQFFHQVFHYGDIFLFEELVKAPDSVCVAKKKSRA